MVNGGQDGKPTERRRHADTELTITPAPRRVVQKLGRSRCDDLLSNASNGNSGARPKYPARCLRLGFSSSISKAVIDREPIAVVDSTEGAGLRLRRSKGLADGVHDSADSRSYLPLDEAQ